MTSTPDYASASLYTMWDLLERRCYSDFPLTPQPATSSWQPVEHTNIARNSVGFNLSPEKLNTGSMVLFNADAVSHHGDRAFNGEMRGVDCSNSPRCLNPQGFITATPSEGRVIAEQASKTCRKQTSCPLCARSMLKRVLPRHLRTVHRTQQPNHSNVDISCVECGEVFARTDILERHRAEQHVDKSSTVTCPGCRSQIRMRAFDSHVKSQKCQRAQLQADLTLFASKHETLTASLKDPGRFDSSTAINPLLAVVHFLYEAVDYYVDYEKVLQGEVVPRQVSVEFLHNYGVAIRATFRALHNPIKAEYSVIACALFILCTVTRFRFLKDAHIVLSRALITLERCAGCALINGSLFRPGGVGRSMITSVFQADESSDEAFERLFSFLDYKWPVNRRRLMDELQMTQI